MERTIAQYQKAFNTMIDNLKSNDSVLAVMVFGSMVTGDLWDESDIDLFVIVNSKSNKIRNIFTEEKDVPVHIKLMNKEKFLQLHESDLRGGFIHRIFASSRLVFSKDMEVTNRYNNGRYYPDIDKERWNMVYLGSVIKSIGICKKYLSNDGIYTAYTMVIKALEDYARLYVNCSGYMISKDAVPMAMNLNDSFKDVVDNLFFEKANIKETIEATIEFLQKGVEKLIKLSTNVLIEFMKDKDKFLSAEDIKSDRLFENFDIEIEDILNELWKRNIIKKESREYRIEEGKSIIKENVYFI
ncbi:nucleotidyltransferase domain-containing protein [Desnuesiella massiliensis]|uniref:nucleotidyltransferase domain-containing protein n=1 Tax=Desnuesiella massiliensis TaxID=1650662 RepID=UPI0006E37F6A|nr:nucleotidyltransferase domain-containing protein [Desnuesiella massiliensis]